jgi:phage recombination protein Bet
MIDAPVAELPTLVKPPARTSLVAREAERYGVEPTKMLDTLKATAFKSDKPISNEQMMALLIVAEQYHLNPFTKEIFAFPDKGGIVPVVGVDGWSRIVNEHPMFDGVEFDMAPDGAWCTCVIYRKDRSHAIRVTEYLQECKRGTQPWSTHPRRMLRHKALIQCARLAFGFAGIYDEDEAHRIVHAGAADVVEAPSAGATRVRAAIAQAAEPPTSEPPASVSDAVIVEDPTEHERDPDLGSGKTYAMYVHEVLHATSQESAEIALDEARGTLNSSQLSELGAAYRGKWKQPEED